MNNWTQTGRTLDAGLARGLYAAVDSADFKLDANLDAAEHEITGADDGT